MKLPISWLKEYAAIGDATPEDVAAALLSVGFETEEIIYAGEEIQNVVTAKVIDCKPHTNSDHLHICMVDTGSEILQIVCGAPNVKEGVIVPCALSGAKLPGGIEIKPGELRGVMSYGMLCSGSELGVDDTVIKGAEVNGLLILPTVTPLGTDIRKILGLDEYVLDVSVTANRPDCQSVVGLAREVAASMGVRFTPPACKYKTVPLNDGEYVPDVKIASDLCSRYTGRLVRDVKIEPSPEWMARRLRLVGIRSINNIVDITNYVLTEIGQPLHSFDVRFIKNGITVRTATEGEKITALDGKEYALSDDMLVIADDEKPVAIAGIMGGEYSGIMPDTKDVFLEAARFDRRSVRVTSRKLGLRSDSSARYEKGVDYLSVDTGRERALALIYKLKAGKIVDVTRDAGIARPQEKVIETTAERICSIIGIPIPVKTIEKILRSLGIGTEVKPHTDALVCTVPLWREDIEDFADLSEEVIRYYGYDNLKPTFLRTAACTIGGESEKDKLTDGVKEVLCGQGAFEMMTYSFIGGKAPDMMMLTDSDSRRNGIKLRNPLGEDTSVLRTQLTHNALVTAALNLSRGMGAFRLFEVGRVFIPVEEGKQPDERTHLSITYAGEKENFYTLKSAVNAVLRYFGAETETRYGTQPYLHPGMSADILLGGKVIGSYGRLHPTAAENYGIQADVYEAEIDLEPLLSLGRKNVIYSTISRFPCVNRDLAVVVPEDTAVGDMEKAIKDACGSSLEELRVFDIYRGEQISEGFKSVAFSLRFRSPDKTLGDAEIQALTDSALGALKEKCGALLR